MSKLTTWVRKTVGRSGGTEFPSQAALASYLQKHPAADASKHTVTASAASAPAPAAAPTPSVGAVAPAVAPSTTAATTPSNLKIPARSASDISTKQAKKEGDRFGAITAMSATSLETNGKSFLASGQVAQAAAYFRGAAIRHLSDGKQRASDKALAEYKALVAHATTNPRPGR